MTSETETKNTEILIETGKVEVIQKKPSQKDRNYSFMHRKDETLDSVDVDEEKDSEISYVIPAQPGSTYWAILRIAYENADKPIRMGFIVDQVAELLEDRDPEKWERYVNKTSITTTKNGEKLQKPANDWRKRIETNVKTLTRTGGSNPYGQRLVERGHILRWEPEQLKGKGAFVLRTTTSSPLPKKSKSKKDK